MTLKTIIAYLPSIETAPQVLKMAVDLAKRHEAHLIGLHVVPPVPQQRVPRYPVLLLERLAESGRAAVAVRLDDGAAVVRVASES